MMNRARASKDAMSSRHATWNKIDEMLTAYIPTSDAEKSVKKKDSTKPISIIVPYSYANLETILAYQTKAFLGSPIYQYEGVGPEDIIGAKLLEIVVNQQARRYKHMLALHTGFRDGLAYGLHASYVPWDTKRGKKVVRSETPIYDTTGKVISTKKTKESVNAILFEGNKIKNIDPYKYLPDVNVSAENVQDGEYVGWFEEENINNLSTEENQGGIFNVKYLKDNLGSTASQSIFNVDDSRRDKFNVRTADSLMKESRNKAILIHMYINIVPREWGLPGSEDNKEGKNPEKYFFLIGNDSIVLDARPLGLNHNMFPVAINAPDYDGYSVSPISRLEMSYGLQEVLNWVFNSHIANVRKSINDMFLVDPSLINMEDMANPEAGKLIRLRRAAWGRGVAGAVQQFPVSDVTRNNIATDAPFVMDLMQKVNASSDASMGVMMGGERRSAAEFNGTMGSLISRLEHISSITSTQYLQDIGYLCASHTQQLMQEDVYVRAVGTWPEVLTNEYGDAGGVKIDPFEIIADYDVIFKDGSHGDADTDTLNFWSNMFGYVSKDESGRFDITKIFQHIARLSGAKDVASFINQPAPTAGLVPDEKVRQEVQAGNLVPTEEV
ncbi:hypothetical protein KAR91_17650 [Candidatus Pacearchaeota archaeon]|nr:hypothetical protein [Candidatus Pacearchaeota archaeon]